MPAVLPFSSTPLKELRFHSPPRRLASAAGTRRATASSRATACSAAETMLDVGALTTMHAARGGGGNVDVVQADTGAGDHLQVAGRGECLGVHLGRGADEQRVRVGERGEQGRAVGAVDVRGSPRRHRALR